MVLYKLKNVAAKKEEIQTTTQSVLQYTILE